MYLKIFYTEHENHVFTKWYMGEEKDKMKIKGLMAFEKQEFQFLKDGFEKAFGNEGYEFVKLP